MRKGRVILLSLVAMFAMSAVAATASASAAEWRVGGSPLVGEKELTEKTTTKENAVLTVAGVNVTVTCTGLLAQKTDIVAKTTMTAKDLQFTGCKANNNCEVTTAITTKELAATVAAVGTEETQITITPKTGTTFANIEFTGAKCGLLGTQPVKGKVIAKDPKGQTENKVQELVLNTKELKVGTNAATMTGAATDTLVSGEAWSFH
jgi:hypothetical protein